MRTWREKLRITGGEPLLRRNLYQLIAELNQIDGIEDIGMTTNGLLLKTWTKIIRCRFASH